MIGVYHIIVFCFDECTYTYALGISSIEWGAASPYLCLCIQICTCIYDICITCQTMLQCSSSICISLFLSGSSDLWTRSEHHFSMPIRVTNTIHLPLEKPIMEQDLTSVENYIVLILQ